LLASFYVKCDEVERQLAALIAKLDRIVERMIKLHGQVGLAGTEPGAGGVRAQGWSEPYRGWRPINGW